METNAMPSPDPVHVKGAGILPGPPPVHVPDDPDGVVLQDTPERWVVTIIVDRDDPRGPVAPPPDWDFGTLLHTRVEVVASERLDPDCMTRVQLDDDAVWLTMDDQGEVTW